MWFLLKKNGENIHDATVPLTAAVEFSYWTDKAIHRGDSELKKLDDFWWAS